MGTKADLEDKREVDIMKVHEFAKKHKISMVFETSAKTGDGVVETFACAIK